MNKRIIQEAGECMRRGWFSLREPVSPQPSASDKLLSFYGEKVGLAARKEFPSGVLVAAPTFAAALAETHHHLACGTETLFEPAFSYAGVNMKADILRRNADSGFDLIEVKAGLAAAEYLED